MGSASWQNNTSVTKPDNNGATGMIISKCKQRHSHREIEKKKTKMKSFESHRANNSMRSNESNRRLQLRRTALIISHLVGLFDGEVWPKSFTNRLVSLDLQLGGECDASREILVRGLRKAASPSKCKWISSVPNANEYSNMQMIIRICKWISFQSCHYKSFKQK